MPSVPKTNWIVRLVVLAVLAFVAVYAVLAIYGPPSISAAGADDVLVQADIHYPGVPVATREPTDRYCESMPALIVWSDGYAFLDESLRNDWEVIRVGQLSASTVQAIGGALLVQGFYVGIHLPELANPSGTWLRVTGKNASGVTIQYRTGSIDSPAYIAVNQLVNPELRPLVGIRSVDPRVKTVMADNLGCNLYMDGD